MDEDYKNVIGAHIAKIEHFISRYENLLAENRRMRELVERKESEIADYRSRLDNSNNKIKELEQKIDRLQIAGAFEASAVDVKEARQNIGRLVREIDKCIALLNN
ncbi:MAG TPA: DivIVA domain-containing protein [Candidatus Coprenecus stercoravium]|uniref:DivIVA domain-containing protein n=1 Tax=Candidatus Coprenecus stercoravium TaxID=2840735 RepID=A0A9D2KA74_9BACT|nr:DivIVA domain-containing protein [Candidatus Coprenecus stercoravium]